MEDSGILPGEFLVFILITETGNNVSVGVGAGNKASADVEGLPIGS